MPEVRSPARSKDPWGLLPPRVFLLQDSMRGYGPQDCAIVMARPLRSAESTWPPSTKSDKAAAAQRSSALRNKSK